MVNGLSWTAFLIYAALFGVLTAGDFFSTNYAIQAGMARELNAVVEGPSGGLSTRFIVINGAIGLFASLLFASRWPHLRDLAADDVRDSAASLLVPVGRTRTQTSYQYVYYLLVVLTMKAIVVMSNLMPPLGLITFPGLIYRASGGILPDWAILSLMILLSAIVGMALMFPVTKRLARSCLPHTL